jgi:hypothetical protein
VRCWDKKTSHELELEVFEVENKLNVLQVWCISIIWLLLFSSHLNMLSAAILTWSELLDQDTSQCSCCTWKNSWSFQTCPFFNPTTWIIQTIDLQSNRVVRDPGNWCICVTATVLCVLHVIIVDNTKRKNARSMIGRGSSSPHI